MQRRKEFVGRTAEIAQLRAALEGHSPRVFYVHGAGGIGKTSLLHAFAAEAERHAIPYALVDARDLEPTRDAVLTALEAAGLGEGRERLILLDTYEHLQAIDAEFSRELLRRTRGATVVVIAGRSKPSAEWRALALWGTDIVPIALRNFSPAETASYLERRGVSNEMAGDIVTFSHGHPLALALMVDAFRLQPRQRFTPSDEPDTIAALYRYFFRGIEAPERRRALEIAAVLRTTSETALGELLEGDGAATFDWLRALNFIETGTRGVYPHDLTREVILAELRWRNPERLSTLVLRAQHYYAELLQTRGGNDLVQIFDDFAFVIGHNPRLRMMLAHREGELAHDILRTGDAEVLEAAVARHEGPTSAAYLRHWVARQPAAFGIVRDASRRVVAFAANVRLDLATDEERAADPIALAGWNHAVALIGGLPRGPVLYARFTMACETHQALSPALALAWRFGAPTLFLPGFTIGFTRFHEGRQWEALVTFSGSRYVPELTHRLDGRNYEVAIQDHRGLSAADWLTAMSERIALGDWREPPPRPVHPSTHQLEEAYARHLRRALRTMNEPLLLAENPLAESSAVRELAGEEATAHERADRLRRLLIDAIEKLRGTERGERWHRVLDAAYVRGTEKHEATAHALGMSYATFRRHLGAATDHLVRTLSEHDHASRLRSKPRS